MYSYTETFRSLLTTLYYDKNSVKSMSNISRSFSGNTVVFLLINTLCCGGFVKIIFKFIII